MVTDRERDLKEREEELKELQKYPTGTWLADKERAQIIVRRYENDYLINVALENPGVMVHYILKELEIVRNEGSGNRVELEAAARELISAVWSITQMYDLKMAGQLSEGQVAVITKATERLNALIKEVKDGSG